MMDRRIMVEGLGKISKLAGLALVMSTLTMALAACGSDGTGEPYGGGGSGAQSECTAGFADCPAGEMCINEGCWPIDGERVSLTVETGQFTEASTYYIEVFDRDEELMMRTPTSSETRTPVWYESTTLTLESRSDWWSIQVWDDNWFFDDVVVSCRIDFDTAQFEVEQELRCDSGSQYLDVRVGAPR